jgi:glycosyltransferase involved in cell wall biosynthesis
MYISIVAPGIWNTVHWDFACALKARGHRVAIYTEDASAPSGWRFTRAVRSGIECYIISDSRRNPWMWIFDRIAKPWLGRRFFTTLSAVRRFLTATRDADACLCEGDWMGVFVALGAPERWVVSIHDTLYLRAPIVYPGRPKSTWRESLKLWVLRRAPRVRANSEVTRNALVAGGCEPAKIFVAPLPVAQWMQLSEGNDVEALRREASPDIRARFDIPPGAALCIVMCRLDPAKGLELAVEALAATHALEWRLLVCGGDRAVAELGSYRQHLERIAGRCGVSGRVIFTGAVPRDDVKRHLAAADLHLAPSVIDTFNYGVVEAAMVGTPSLMSEGVGAGPWIVEAGGGEVVPGRHPDAWARRIEAAYARRYASEERRAMSDAIRTRLAPDAIAKEMVQQLAAG